MNNYYIFLFIFIIFLSSCFKKEEPIVPPILPEIEPERGVKVEPLTKRKRVANHSIQVSDEGSCEGYSFVLRSDNQSINTTWPLYVLRNNAPVYSYARGNRIKTTLKFSKILDALSISDSKTSGRVKICESGCLPDEALGWMDRQDLLCRINPLKNEDGLERKGFIRTPAKPEIIKNGRRIIKKTAVTAYSCYNKSCKSKSKFLSRFEMYFIFAEKQQRYLLGDKYNLLMGPPLIGWVDKDKIIPWNTTLQLRPKEQVKYIRAYPDLPTAYISRSRNLRKAVDLAGGNIWYKFPLHVPLLDIKNYRGKKYYHVSVPGIGMRGFDIKKNINNHQINKHIIVQNVAQYSKSSTINEVILKLRAGQSVKDIIEEGMIEGDMPVLYWEILEKDLCQAAKKQCKPSVDHRMIDAYIPVSENIVEEIWISSRELHNLKMLLRPLYHNIKNKGFFEQKREFIRILAQEIQKILGEPILMIAGETLGEVLKRKNGLPVREHSPFMQYTKEEILNMKICEFHRLIKWIESISGLLTRLMADPTNKIEYELSPYSDSQCPDVSAKGRNLQRLRLKPPKPLGPSDEYRYQHNFRGETIYSIPKDFLP